MAGYHEQAVLDANCHRIVSSSSSVTLDDNMKQRDPPVHDMNLVYTTAADAFAQQLD
jgi:hypothetical protein